MATKPRALYLLRSFEIVQILGVPKRASPALDMLASCFTLRFASTRSMFGLVAQALGRRLIAGKGAGSPGIESSGSRVQGGLRRSPGDGPTRASAVRSWPVGGRILESFRRHGPPIYAAPARPSVSCLTPAPGELA